MSYLRIATRPSVFEQPLTPDEAMANIETILNLPQARFLSEEKGFREVYRKLTANVRQGVTSCLTHLAAILRQHGIKRLYTQIAIFEVRFP